MMTPSRILSIFLTTISIVKVWAGRPRSKSELWCDAAAMSGIWHENVLS